MRRKVFPGCAKVAVSATRGRTPRRAAQQMPETGPWLGVFTSEFHGGDNPEPPRERGFFLGSRLPMNPRAIQQTAFRAAIGGHTGIFEVRLA